MTETHLQNLIARLEKATGPDRELGKVILLAVGWVREPDGTWISPTKEAWFDYNPGFPDPTASIDAALKLVPEGWAADITAYAGGLGDARLWSDDVARNASRRCSTKLSNTRPASPAIALCIAALKARGNSQ